MKQAFATAIGSIMDKDERVLLLIGDLGYGVLDRIIGRHSDRVVNMGICEQNMMSTAAGLAHEGFSVFCYSIANFPSLRCLEQIRNDVAADALSVKIVSVGAGFAYGTAGMSHLGTEDMNIIRCLPNMTVYNPCDPVDAGLCTWKAYQTEGPCYLRLGRGHEPAVIGEGGVFAPYHVVKHGGEVALVASGAILNDVWQAALRLQEEGTDCAVYGISRIKPLGEGLVEELSRYPLVLTFEDGNIIGGVGSSLLEAANEAGVNLHLLRKGLDDEFVSVVGSPGYLRMVYGLDRDSIVQCVKKELHAI